MWSRVALKSPAMMTSLPAAHCAASQSRSLRQLVISPRRGDTACTATIVGPSPESGVATTVGDTLVLPGGPVPPADSTL